VFSELGTGGRDARCPRPRPSPSLANAPLSAPATILLIYWTAIVAVLEGLPPMVNTTGTAAPEATPAGIFPLI
jgi:hypothetical protein